jgi:hypothetical protein
LIGINKWYQGMTLENGPFLFGTNVTNFKVNEFAWNKRANIIYL